MSEEMFEVPKSRLEEMNSMREEIALLRESAEADKAAIKLMDEKLAMFSRRALVAETAHESANELLVKAEAERDALQVTLEEVEREVAQVYSTITNGKFAKANTEAVYILEAYQRVLEAEVETFRDTLVDNEAYGVQLIHERDAALARVKDLEKACQSAVHALMSYQYGNGSPDLAKEVAKHVQEVLAKNSQACVWKKEEDPEWNTWSSSCGQMWVFESDGPKDNDMHYCPFCGLELFIGVNSKDGEA